MHATAGGQQQLRLCQIERRRTRDQQQHPVHQQIGNQPLHISSLVHPRASRLYILFSRAKEALVHERMPASPQRH
jgi:hypothetical protein